VDDLAAPDAGAVAGPPVLRAGSGSRPRRQEVAETCFWRAWAQVGKGSVLSGLGLAPKYWQEEIGTVIKGRGLTTFDQYARLARIQNTTFIEESFEKIA